MYENILKNKDTYSWSKLCTTGNDFSMFGESIYFGRIGTGWKEIKWKIK